MRIVALILAGAGLAFAGSPAAAQATTRIETRPFYGATVTMEEGVRVFRALPPHERVIINPDGKTPLSLSFNQSTNYIYGGGGETYVRDVGAEAGSYAAGTFFPNRHFRRMVPRRPAAVK